MGVQVLAGLIAWAIIGFLLWRMIRTIRGKVGNTSAVSTANSTAGSAATADVGGIHLHFHLGTDGIGGTHYDDNNYVDSTDHYIVNPDELRRVGIERVGIESLPNPSRRREVPLRIPASGIANAPLSGSTASHNGVEVENDG